MVHLGCPSCDRLISVPPEGRIPPWCPHCGQNLKAGDSNQALGKWNPSASAPRPRGVESLYSNQSAKELADLPASVSLPPYVSDTPLPENGWTCQACGCEFVPWQGRPDIHRDWLKALTGVHMPSGPCPACASHHPMVLPAFRLVAHGVVTFFIALVLMYVGLMSLGWWSPLVGDGL